MNLLRIKQMGKGLSMSTDLVQALIMLIVSIIIFLFFLLLQSENILGTKLIQALPESGPVLSGWKNRLDEGQRGALPEASSNCFTGRFYLQGRPLDLVLPLGSWLLRTKPEFSY